MISLQVLQNNISKCPANTKLSLPDQSRDFVQKPAYDFKVKKLKHSVGVNKLLNQIPDYTMQKEIDKLQNNIDNNDMENENIVNNLVPNSSLILITENSTIDLPETILDLFGMTGICQEDYYIYGVRNPDSFYNSLLLQLKNSFILGKKNDKRNNVSTFKNEIVIKFDAFYKQLKYKSYGIVRTKFLNNILNTDNYVNYDVLLYLADYLQINLLVVDIIDMKYCNINYQKTQLSSFNQDPLAKQEIDFDNYNLEHNHDKCLMIIKYDGDTYLPIMCKTGYHYIDSSIIQTLEDQNYSQIYSEEFKTRKSVTVDVDTNIEKPNENQTGNKDSITDIIMGNQNSELDALDKILNTVKAKKDAKIKAKADKKANSKLNKVEKKSKPKEEKEQKKGKGKEKEKEIKLPVENLGDSSDEEKNDDILPDDWLVKFHQYTDKEKLEYIKKVKTEDVQTFATNNGINIIGQTRDGKPKKVSKLALINLMYKKYLNDLEAADKDNTDKDNAEEEKTTLDDDDDTSNKCEPDDILSRDWIEHKALTSNKTKLGKIKLEVLQNTAMYYGADIYKVQENGTRVKLTKLQLASRIYTAYRKLHPK